MATKETTRSSAWFDRHAAGMSEPWHAFEEAVLEGGLLDPKSKALIAAAAGTVMRCRESTVHHIRGAEEAGATKEEIAEALFVATLMGSGTQLFWMKEDYEALLGDGEKQPWFRKRVGEMGARWQAFHDAVYEPSALDRKTKELLATVCGTLLRCRHCTRAHIVKARRYDATEEEISEALMIGALVASRSQLTWMIDDYEALLG